MSSRGKGFGTGTTSCPFDGAVSFSPAPAGKATPSATQTVATPARRRHERVGTVSIASRDEASQRRAVNRTRSLAAVGRPAEPIATMRHQ